MQKPGVWNTICAHWRVNLQLAFGTIVITIVLDFSRIYCLFDLWSATMAWNLLALIHCRKHSLCMRYFVYDISCKNTRDLLTKKAICFPLLSSIVSVAQLIVSNRLYFLLETCTSNTPRATCVMFNRNILSTVVARPMVTKQNGKNGFDYAESKHESIFRRWNTTNGAATTPLASRGKNRRRYFGYVQYIILINLSWKFDISSCRWPSLKSETYAAAEFSVIFCAKSPVPI